MQFHSYATHGKPYVVKALTAYTPIGIFHESTGEPTDIITPCIHPHIHITWHPCRWVGVHHRVALPFQDTTAISRIPHTIIYGHCSLVQDLIAHLGSLTHPKPSHQQVKPWGCALRQSLNAVKDYANKRLSLGEIIKSIPVKALQHRTIKEFLALIKPQRELDETKVYPVIHHSYTKATPHSCTKMFQRNSALPIMYLRHMRLGSFSSRYSHSSPCRCHHTGARSTVPAKKSNTAPIVPTWQCILSSSQWA